MNASSSNDQTHLQWMQRQVGHKKLSILHSTIRTRALLNESETIGVNVAVELVKQGERLENVEKSCNRIDTDLVSTQRSINRLNTLLGGMTNCFRPPKSSFSKISSRKSDKNKTITATTVKTPVTRRKIDNDIFIEKPYNAMDDIERTTNDVLDDIDGALVRIKGLATDMNCELTRQLQCINGLEEKARCVNDDVLIVDFLFC